MMSLLPRCLSKRALSTAHAARDYAAAIQALNSLQSNHATLSAIRSSGRVNQTLAIPEMVAFADRAGLKVEELGKLNAIHVAGTKGKGSTCAFVSSILTAFFKQNISEGRFNEGTGIVGLYTSPHLRFARERIQIDNTPLAEGVFAEEFFTIWDRLSASGNDGKPMPMYFRFLTLMAFHTFLKGRINTSVIECGVGGEHDSTNIIPRPSITAVTSLGIDHQLVLGHTLPEIAWHKAGIFKPGALALTAPQPEAAMSVLRQRAEEKGVELHVVEDVHPQLESGEIKLGLAAEYQKVNASLAVSVAAAHLRRMGYVQDVPDLLNDPSSNLPSTFVAGLTDARWPGRSDIRPDKDVKGLTWFLDGAHTVESITLAAKWFAQEVAKRPNIKRRALIFNQQSRDAKLLLSTLYNTLQQSSISIPLFDAAIFTANLTYASTGYRPDLVSINNSPADVTKLAVQTDLSSLWEEFGEKGLVSSSIEQAVKTAREITGGESRADNSEDGMILVIGSLHLVGGVIDVLEEGG